MLASGESFSDLHVTHAHDIVELRSGDVEVCFYQYMFLPLLRQCFGQPPVGRRFLLVWLHKKLNINTAGPPAIFARWRCPWAGRGRSISFRVLMSTCCVRSSLSGRG